MKRGSARSATAGVHAAAISVDAPPAAVERALTTLAGLRGWWTEVVDGDPGTVDGVVVLGFPSVGERIELVVEAAPPADAAVRWRCTTHTGHPEWAGTRIELAVDAVGRGQARVRLRHHGLVPTLGCFEACERGWEHFLRSLAAHAAGRGGQPFRRA
jgi:uncharacterized protein YndB with AHSA1/START domain